MHACMHACMHAKNSRESTSVDLKREKNLCSRRILHNDSECRAEICHKEIEWLLLPGASLEHTLRDRGEFFSTDSGRCPSHQRTTYTLHGINCLTASKE